MGNWTLLRALVLLTLGLGLCLLLMSSPQRSNVAYADAEFVKEVTPPAITREIDGSKLDEDLTLYKPSAGQDSSFEVQAVLNSSDMAVISGAIDGVLKRLPFKSGDVFKKGDVLAEYNCDYERARHKEILAQLRASERQKKAYDRLIEQDVVADVEYVSIVERYQQDRALLEQTRARIDLCTIHAPFSGRVTEKSANNYEAVRSGRVLMEISSLEPLKAELLVPSVWLRWLNVGAPLRIEVHETGLSYDAKITRVHGKVDAVTQTVHVVAKLDKYEEKLLPGMSGRAMFKKPLRNKDMGFLGIKITNGE